MMKEKKEAALGKAAERILEHLEHGYKGMREGDRFYCEVCGLTVSIDETCSCVEGCDIFCCGKLMKPKN